MSESDNLAYQGLHPDQILACVEHLGYEADGRLLALNSYENRVYQVGIEGQAPLIAKFYRPGRWSDAAILEEHEFALEMDAADIPLVGPLEIDNQTLHHIDAFRFALYPRKGGRWPELDDEGLLQQIGRLVARMHTVGETRSFQHRPTLDSESFGYASMESILDADVLPHELIDAYETLAEDLLERIDETIDNSGAHQIIRLHGDLHPSNLLARGESVHIVDLDDARSGPSVQDIWMFLSGSRDEQSRQLDVILQGYSEFRRFSTVELQLIEPLRTLRIMHYAAWLTRRYSDPAFQQAFPWFKEIRYWEEHILSLREQQALLEEPPLEWLG
jgi:Ser/Thr protein kinase RdoA (MazF antagonist)